MVEHKQEEINRRTYHFMLCAGDLTAADYFYPLYAFRAHS